MDMNILSHTKWNCKYHIVFAPKFRRKIAYGQLKQDIANILSMLCKRKGVNIVEAEICPDYLREKGGFECNSKYIIQELYKQRSDIQYVWFLNDMSVNEQ